jgi:protein TonB
MSAFYKYLSENLKYPQKALQHSIGGKVFLQATISKTGEISNIIVVKGIGYGCDEEAVRVLKSAPKWIPGKQRGRPVNVRMVVPITFVIKS